MRRTLLAAASMGATGRKSGMCDRVREGTARAAQRLAARAGPRPMLGPRARHVWSGCVHACCMTGMRAGVPPRAAGRLGRGCAHSRRPGRDRGLFSGPAPRMDRRRDACRLAHRT
eukprot:73276-Chlamydomonas_euryale.AAC.1